MMVKENIDDYNRKTDEYIVGRLYNEVEQLIKK